MVHFFLGTEIPKVAVFPHASVHTLQHNDNIALICNLTERGNQASTALKRISWFKNGALLQSVRNPDPSVPMDTLDPLVLRNVRVEDGGNYTCLLEVRLRNVRPHNVYDHTMIHSKYVCSKVRQLCQMI